MVKLTNMASYKFFSLSIAALTLGLRSLAFSRLSSEGSRSARLNEKSSSRMGASKTQIEEK